jgi:LPS O-antigen subunit length determinant protein (WzzB/FepE family)
MSFWIFITIIAVCTAIAALLALVSINRHIERAIRRSQERREWEEQDGQFLDKHDVRNSIRRKIGKAL